MPEHSHKAPLVECAEEGCAEAFRDHRWGSTKAYGEGWFIQRDGTAWCPQHTPEWVAEWRASRAAGVPPEPWRKG